LLLVIATIGVLMGLLVPALGGAREAARRTQCLNNLRQMALTALQYVDRHGGSFPVAYATRVEGDVLTSYAWDVTVIAAPGRPVQIMPGTLWEGAATLEIQQCPSYEGEANWAAAPYTGYNYNTSYIGHGEHENVPEPARLQSLANLSRTALFGDGQYGGGANKFMRAPFASEGDATFSGRWAGTQGYRHLECTNVAFCDGHAETRADAFVETDDYQGAKQIAPGTGFLSPDNRLYGESE
jgi:prepilin-type processing-associated H-X9-DG protein